MRASMRPRRPQTTAARMARVLLGLVVVVVIVAVGAAVLTGIGVIDSVDRATYVAANERTFKTLPVPPHARLLRSATHPRRNDGARLVGYTTTHVFVLPPGTSSAAVIAFYRRRLPRAWERQIYLEPNRYRGPIVQFRAGVQQLEVAVRRRKPQLVVTVDHDYY